jgi:two-component system, chemotaxis family, protein-glutamate methylesterase/glutaminase
VATQTNTLKVVAVGASAGGVEALTQSAAGLPPDLPYAVLVALHMPVGAVLGHRLSEVYSKSRDSDG